ncbi:nuclear transport factor 2 family protein [Phenylobacterium sp. J367]|uniref:nuclear transport factor 2 family protein n=1 Tax=Phenylobacterium sp. J367 TaxID=2898435 RepID=UPI002151CB9D|nr:nuclear transport factor 2 family protein [Phenylobacterium sp. J367]MCR5878533.1 nuclear transport factor 2 family protein [Phenylobacterium sp. J367]
MRRLVLLAAAVLLCAAAPARITDAEVRAFVDRQTRAWNAGDVGAWAALHTADARFTDQTRTGKGEIVAYGTSTLPQARKQAQRFFAGSKIQETGRIEKVEIAPDGASARVTQRKASRITAEGRVRTSCAVSVQTVVKTAGRLRSQGRVDTLYKCPR